MAGSPDDGTNLRVNRSCVISGSELQWRFTTSGGPGGQHANTAHTAVELRLDLAGSTSLGPHQRARLIEKLGPVVTVVASDERSQARNRQIARERLRRKLAGALVTSPQRQATRPRRSAVRRRLEAKRRRSETKDLRRRPPPD